MVLQISVQFCRHTESSLNTKKKKKIVHQWVKTIRQCSMPTDKTAECAGVNSHVSQDKSDTPRTLALEQRLEYV